MRCNSILTYAQDARKLTRKQQHTHTHTTVPRCGVRACRCCVSLISFSLQFIIKHNTRTYTYRRYIRSRLGCDHSRPRFSPIALCTGPRLFVLCTHTDLGRPTTSHRAVRQPAPSPPPPPPSPPPPSTAEPHANRPRSPAPRVYDCTLLQCRVSYLARTVRVAISDVAEPSRARFFHPPMT